MFSDSTELNTPDTLQLHTQNVEHWQLIAGGVAHDFNNLLTSILGQSTLALRQLPEDASARRHIEKVIKAVEYATALSDQLLSYSNGTQNQINLINLNLLIQDNLSLLDAIFLDGISLQLELAPGLPPIQARPGQLQQVVMNLLINAAEAIRPDKGTITIRTGTQTFVESNGTYQKHYGRSLSGDTVFLQVQDNGAGMSAATLNQIFKPYFTTKPAGRGLGLSAIHDIMRVHQGSITVNSQEGQGTAFTVYFPCGIIPQSPPFPL